jgi:hypothetical protein
MCPDEISMYWDVIYNAYFGNLQKSDCVEDQHGE